MHAKCTIHRKKFSGAVPHPRSPYWGGDTPSSNRTPSAPAVEHEALKMQDWKMED